MFNTLQAGRAVAALLVVVYHLNALLSLPVYGGREVWAGFRSGHSGVNFFFVLSGFIIAWAHWIQVGDIAALQPFLRKRIVRVYPVYWMVLISIVPIYFLMPTFGTGYERDPGELLASFALFPSENPPILAVAWTLQHEMLFYFVFCTLFFSRRVGFAVVGLWTLACTVALPFHLTFPYSFLFAPVNLLFVFGLLAFTILRHRPPAFPLLWLVTGILIFVLASWLDVTNLMGVKLTMLLYGIGSLIAVIGAVAAEKVGAIAAPRLLVAFGAASYACYLVHFVVLSILAKLWFAVFGTRFDPIVPFVAMLATAIATSVAFHRLVELPLLRMGQKLTTASEPNIGGPQARS